MHETAVVMGLLDILDRAAEAERIVGIDEVRMKLGRLRGLDARQLAATFEVLAEGRLAEGARLIVEEVGVTARCTACGTEFEAKGWSIVCPSCGSDAAEVLTGRELFVESFDGRRGPGERT